MRRPFYATDIPGLQSTAVPQPPAPPPLQFRNPAIVQPPHAPPVEGDAYAEGYAAGYAAAMRERPVLCVRAVVEAPAIDPTADRAQVAALGTTARP